MTKTECYLGDRLQIYVLEIGGGILRTITYGGGVFYEKIVHIYVLCIYVLRSNSYNKDFKYLMVWSVIQSDVRLTGLRY
jgi:hypothetical protein